MKSDMIFICIYILYFIPNLVGKQKKYENNLLLLFLYKDIKNYLRNEYNKNIFM